MRTEPTLVEILYFDGCPGIERVLPVVGPLAEAAGARVLQRRVETPRRPRRSGSSAHRRCASTAWTSSPAPSGAATMD
jgi:hypothetical protein